MNIPALLLSISLYYAATLVSNHDSGKHLATASNGRGSGCKNPMPVSAELQSALNRLSDAGVIEGKRGSLTFFRWSSAQPPTLVRLGLWGAKIDNEHLD